MRACERLDPRAVFGRPWVELSGDERESMLAYELVRNSEENPPEPKR